MELYTIEAKGFKEFYYRSITLALVVITGSFLLVTVALGAMVGPDPKRQWSMPVLLLLIVLSVLFVYYYKRQLAGVPDRTGFENQVKAYRRIYSQKRWFHLFSCFLMALMYTLTTGPNFFYFSLIDFFILLTLFANRALFKKGAKK